MPAWLPLSAAWFDERILAALGKQPSIPLDGVRMAQKPMYYDASKAVRELGLPQTPLETALKDAVDWFVAQGYVGGSTAYQFAPELSDTRATPAQINRVPIHRSFVTLLFKQELRPQNINHIAERA